MRLSKWIDASGAIRVAGIVFLAYVTGLFSGLYDWLPARVVKEARTNAGIMKGNIEAAVLQTPYQHIARRHFPADGVLKAERAEMSPGVTLVSGLFGQKLGFRLFGADGQQLYEWPIDFFKIAPELMQHRYHALIHGEVLLPGGDIVANLDGRGLVRFDRCGRIAWRNQARTHHSVFLDGKGHIWAPTAGPIYDDPGVMTVPFKLDRIGEFDIATGAQLREIDAVDVLHRSDLVGLIQENESRADDVGHMNDVEILDEAMAPAFPMFAAGDILVSWRNLNQLWVIDGKDEKIKWVSQGGTLGQHDPDFRPDGMITALDNRPADPINRENGYPGRGGGSRIVAINPADHSHTPVFSSSPEHPFYTPYRGKQQFLPNGNLLIAETDAGRAFEVTPEGKVVWEFVNGWDDTRVGWVTGAQRYPTSYGDFTAESCPAND